MENVERGEEVPSGEAPVPPKKPFNELFLDTAKSIVDSQRIEEFLTSGKPFFEGAAVEMRLIKRPHLLLKRVRDPHTFNEFERMFAQERDDVDARHNPVMARHTMWQDMSRKVVLEDWSS